VTDQWKTPAAWAKASGGDQGVQTGVERTDHTPPDGAVTHPRIREQEAWLRQIGDDASQTNGAFRAAWALSTMLRRRGERARSTLRKIGAVAGVRGDNGESAVWVRRGLLLLERGGHLWIDRREAHGRRHHHRYALILKSATTSAA